MKTTRNILAICFLLTAGISMAQNNGSIKVTVVDEKKQPLPFTAVAVMEDSTVVKSGQTDINGEFTFKDVIPGRYNINAQMIGYNKFLYKGVKVESNITRYLDINMSQSAINLTGAVVTAEWVAPAFNSDFSTVQRINADQIEHSAVGKNDVMQLVLTRNSDVMPTNDGKGLYMRGSRSGSTSYYVDGNRTMEAPQVPGMGIGGMEVLTGGVPAQYGDCTGGIILITTKDYKVEMLRKKNAQEDRAAAKEAKKNNDVKITD
ncbi:MAG: carboxypeptidase regulatory-like domain-containing protein [Bacteroidia bacterium]